MSERNCPSFEMAAKLIKQIVRRSNHNATVRHHQNYNLNNRSYYRALFHLSPGNPICLHYDRPTTQTTFEMQALLN